MSVNPYLKAYRVRRRNRRRSAVGSIALNALLSLLAVGLLAVVLRPVFLGFLDEGQSALGPGVSGIVLRLGMVLVGLTTIDMYGAMIRGKDREVLASLPVDPGPVSVYVVTRVMRERLWVIGASAAVLLPVAIEASVALWAIAVVALAGLWAFSLPASAVAHMLAVRVAESPTAAPLLDLVRGANTRGQAAFIYAPGMVLVAATGALVAASEGTPMLWRGEPLGALLILLPPVFGGVIALWVPSLAQRTWYRATAVLSDIDARVAAVQEDAGESGHVYLDWTVRFLPSSLHLYVLKDLRHGWRGRRTWLMGSWILGGAAAAAGWTSHASGPARGLSVVVLSVVLCAAVAIVLERDEPQFLRWWLPQPAGRRWTARGVVLGLWMQPIVWPALVIVGFFHGLGDAVTVLAAGQVAVAGAVVLAMACGVLRNRGAWIYAPVALALAAFIVLGFVGIDELASAQPLGLAPVSLLPGSSP